MVGSRIRELRLSAGMTLTALARAVSVSPGLISQVERGLTDPSLETLRRIAHALDVPLFNLFQDAAADSPAQVVRRDNRIEVRSPRGGIVYTRISAGSGRLEVLEGVLQPGGASAEELWAHPSEECAVVLDGTVTVEIGTARHELGPGDSCSFDSRFGHRYVNTGDAPARFIVTVTPPSY